jgi:4'-phosphopantetheinyl transferase
VLTLSCLDVTQPDIDAFVAAYAIDTDRQHSARYWRPRRRLQSLAARALLRRDASELQVWKPGPWELQSNADLQLKIVCATDSARVLDASVAHSGDLVVGALSDIGPVGVDIELIQPNRKFSDMAGWAFGPGEREAGAGTGPAAFYRVWTLREALAKACGIGFPLVVDGRDYFARSPAEESWTQDIDGAPWTFGVKTVRKSYAVAVAVRREDSREAVIAALEHLR